MFSSSAPFLTHPVIPPLEEKDGLNCRISLKQWGSCQRFKTGHLSIGLLLLLFLTVPDRKGFSEIAFFFPLLQVNLPFSCGVNMPIVKTVFQVGMSKVVETP